MECINRSCVHRQHFTHVRNSTSHLRGETVHVCVGTRYGVQNLGSPFCLASQCRKWQSSTYPENKSLQLLRSPVHQTQHRFPSADPSFVFISCVQTRDVDPSFEIESHPFERGGAWRSQLRSFQVNHDRRATQSGRTGHQPNMDRQQSTRGGRWCQQLQRWFHHFCAQIGIFRMQLQELVAEG
jgi:hypothetical protein